MAKAVQYLLQKRMTKKILGATEYEQLPKGEQYDLLHKDGVHVGKRKLGSMTVILFQLYGFYVEIHYKKYRREIDHLIVSAETDLLQPYLEQIHVRDLEKKNDGK